LTCFIVPVMFTVSSMQDDPLMSDQGYWQNYALAGSDGDDFLPHLNKTGVFHGRNIAQLEKDDIGFWRPRPQHELEAIFSAGYGLPVDLSLRMQGFETVAKALNDNNPCLAAIALVQTRIPPLPDSSAAERMAEADRLAKGSLAYLTQPRVAAGEPGAGQWMAGLGETLSALAERGLPWLLRASARLAGPLAIATGVLFPDNAHLESNGAVPGFPGLDYRFSEGRLMLIQDDCRGGASPLFSGLPDKGGFYRNDDGTVVGRAVGNTFMIDNEGASSLISAATAQNGKSDGDGASPGLGHNGGPSMDQASQTPGDKDPDQQPPLPVASPSVSGGNGNSTQQSQDGPSTDNVVLPNNPSQLAHIFRVEDGHLSDTPENRQSLLDIVNNPEIFLGTDTFGNRWYAKAFPDGTQLWGTVRNGVVQNGGLNSTPRTSGSISGLSGAK
jgi:hypothetical protein